MFAVRWELGAAWLFDRTANVEQLKNGNGTVISSDDDPAAS